MEMTDPKMRWRRNWEAGLLAAQSTWMLESCPPSHLFKIPALGLIPPFVLPKASTKIFFFSVTPSFRYHRVNDITLSKMIQMCSKRAEVDIFCLCLCRIHVLLEKLPQVLSRISNICFWVPVCTSGVAFPSDSYCKGGYVWSLHTLKTSYGGP